MSYELIETVTLASTATSIQFTSIPQDGTDLILRFSGRFSSGNNTRFSFITNSGSTSSKVLSGNGSSVSNTSTTGFVGEGVSSSLFTSNTFGSVNVYIGNYTASIFKSFLVDGVTENNNTTSPQSISANKTSGLQVPVTTITISGGDSFAQHSTASLYKITAS